MNFPPHGSHLFREFVHKKKHPSLISYGLVVSKRKPDYHPAIACSICGMKKLMLSQLTQGKEKEEESLESLIRRI